MVDDRPENLLALESILGDLGENLVRATSGREALRYLLETEFAVILLDVQMPEMDGFETATLIRERERSQHTPIIFLTARDRSEGNVFRGYMVGAVDYLLKPFAPEVLKAKVSVFIELFRKTEELKRQSELLRHTNRELGKTNKLMGRLYNEIEETNTELRGERDFISAILATAGSCVMVLNTEGRILRFNPAAERASGFSAEEVFDRRPEDLFLAGEDISQWQEGMEKVLTGNYPMANESCWITRTGGRRQIAWSNTALVNDSGEVSYVICTGVDITDIKDAERAIRELNEDLERRVQQRTVELQAAISELKNEISERERVELQLKQAKEFAEAANRAKDQFLAVLSHELRTPLNPVLATVQVLEEDPSLPEELRSWIEIIRRNVELEARLIDDLLDLTRITEGKLKLNLEPVDVHGLIGHVHEICRADAEQKHISINMKLDAVDHVVRGDSARLHQVVWNLVKNAIKFTPNGGTVDIITTNTPEGWPHRCIAIGVRDTGIGIEAELLPKIFDAFEQGDPSITHKFGGLGLGLAISKSLIDVHGGSILAASDGHGKGATFTVVLTTCEAVEPLLNGTAPAMHEEQPRHGRKVLIVEDNHDTSQVMRTLLERRGYDVSVVGTIADALEAVLSGAFDLMISDIGLPDGSGIELMTKLSLEKPIRSIAVSGYGMEEDIRRSREAGFAEHLTKPINVRQLEEAVQRLIEEV